MHASNVRLRNEGVRSWSVFYPTQSDLYDYNKRTHSPLLSENNTVAFSPEQPILKISQLEVLTVLSNELEDDSNLVVVVVRLCSRWSLPHFMIAMCRGRLSALEGPRKPKKLPSFHGKKAPTGLFSLNGFRHRKCSFMLPTKGGIENQFTCNEIHEYSGLLLNFEASFIHWEVMHMSSSPDAWNSPPTKHKTKLPSNLEQNFLPTAKILASREKQLSSQLTRSLGHP